MATKAFEQRFPVIDIKQDREELARFLDQDAKKLLLDSGAVLLRNTGITDMTQLEAGARRFLTELHEAYVGGVVPRTNHSRYVFSSTELNALFNLKLHNEMAYQSNFPRYVTFFCKVASKYGGETPIAHETDIRQGLDQDWLRRVSDDNVVYTRRYLSARTARRRTKYLSSMYVSWQSAFQTEDAGLAAEKCEALDLEHRWLSDGSLEVRSVLPMFREIPENGRRVYFNQLLSQNFSRVALGSVAYLLHRLTGSGASSAPRDSALQRGGLVDTRALADLDRAYRAAKTEFRWREGDWLLVDNLQAMHARNSFIGKRAIWVVMGH